MALKQPNTVKTLHKKLFSYLHQKGVLYSFAKDFKNPGGFQAWWNEIYSLGQEFRSDLWNKPNQAAVDPNAEAKIRQYGNYHPFTSHTDCLKLLIRSTLKYGSLRGSSEVSLVHQLILFLMELYTYLLFLFTATYDETSRLQNWS